MAPIPSNSANRRRGLVLAWMPVSQRSRTLAERLDYDLLLMGRRGFRRPWSAALAYPILAWRTVSELRRRRPAAVVAIVPPVAVPLVVLPVARLLGARLALDVHSGALLDRRWRWSIPLLRALARRSQACVVTLDSLARRLDGTGRVVVLADPLPEMGPAGPDPRRSDGRPVVVAVCGWGDDEPIEALVGAARGAPWQLRITGKPVREMAVPDNVRLTGHLAQADYAALLAAADVVVVLTTREDTLLSGAWEATALARPLLLSGTRSLRDAFGGEADYTDASAAGIRRAVDAVLADPTAASRAVARRQTWLHRGNAALEELRRALEPDAVTVLPGGRTDAG